MIDDQQYAAWLQRGDSQRVWLLELEHSAGVETLAHGTYTQPGSTVWLDALEDIELEDGINTDRSIQDLTVRNTGRFDSWLGREWLGHPVRLYLGDRQWPRSEFRLTGSMINGGIDSAQGGELRFLLHNPLAALDAPLAEGEGEPVPVLFGTVFNVTVPVPDTNLGYVVHTGPVTITAVRDKGGAVSYSAGDPINGFRLQSMPRGAITFDAVAAGSTPAELVQLLCAGTALVPNAASLAALPDWPLGISARSDESRRSVLDQLLTGLGAAAVINALGELEIRSLQPPDAVPVQVLRSSAIIDSAASPGLEIIAVEPPAGRVEIRYGRNYTTQDASGLNTGTDVAQGGISPADLQRYGTQWQHVSDTLSSNPLARTIEVDTPFADKTTAEQLRQETRELCGVTRYRARLSCMSSAVQLIRAGDTVQITYPRYGLGQGRCVRVLNNQLTTGELEVYW